MTGVGFGPVGPDGQGPARQVEGAVQIATGLEGVAQFQIGGIALGGGALLQLLKV